MTRMGYAGSGASEGRKRGPEWSNDRCDRVPPDPLVHVRQFHRPRVRLVEIVSPQRAPDRLKFLAGSESLMGAFVGDVLPEETAAVLRDTPGRGA